ncbi:MAG: hypothetical protein Q9183_005286 [Haloplaca sp. 2 TL-2023]
MAIHSAQSVAPRTFGGQLSSTPAVAARASNQQEPETVTTQRRQNNTNSSFPAIDNLNLNSSNPTSSQPPSSPVPNHALTPQEQARRLHHASVMDRASTLLKHDLAKISAFRSAVSSYQTSALSATQLIDNFFSLFDVAATDLGTLIKELAEIYENEGKRNDLLRAWNDWRAINEDYPSLPGPDGVLPGSSAAAAGSGGYRVLKLKNSTAQSSRSAVSRHGSWGSGTGTNPFPNLPAPTSTNRVGAGRVAPLPWATGSSSQPRPTSSAGTGRRAQVNGVATSSASEAFPSLPAASKPNTLMAGLTRGSVKWDDQRRSNNNSPWASGPTQPPPVVENEDREGAGNDEATTGKKKGKANKKQTLYKFG